MKIEDIKQTLMTYKKCQRCAGSGEIGVDILGRFERAGPVPEDAKGFHVTSCRDCGGLGVVMEVIHDGGGK